MHLIGGQLSITSTPGLGSRIEATLPSADRRQHN
jgi:signal transduction histidine kinase